MTASGEIDGVRRLDGDGILSRGRRDPPDRPEAIAHQARPREATRTALASGPGVGRARLGGTPPAGPAAGPDSRSPSPVAPIPGGGDGDIAPSP
jgi:hypothetical protein